AGGHRCARGADRDGCAAGRLRQPVVRRRRQGRARRRVGAGEWPERAGQRPRRRPRPRRPVQLSRIPAPDGGKQEGHRRRRETRPNPDDGVYGTALPDVGETYTLVSRMYSRVNDIAFSSLKTEIVDGGDPTQLQFMRDVMPPAPTPETFIDVFAQLIPVLKQT